MLDFIIGTGCVLRDLRVEAEAIVDNLKITETNSVFCEFRAETKQIVVHINITVARDRACSRTQATSITYFCVCARASGSTGV